MASTVAKIRSRRSLIKRRQASVDSDDATDPLRNLANDLNSLRGTVCPSAVERYDLLKRRDNILQLIRKEQLGNQVGKRIVVQGTCSDLCSEKERYRRMVQNAVHFYECDESGEAVPEKFVTDYSRSAADQEHPLPHELRSPIVLQASMNFILDTMANRRIPQQEAPRWYDFVWSRTRAIRKELTQQKIISPIAVDVLEKCCRIHIYAAHEFCEVDAGGFDQRMNTENLSKCLQSLRHMYDDLAKRNIFLESEPEFRSYDVLLNLCDSNILQQVFALRLEVRDALDMKLAVKLFLAFNTSNYVQFFRLIRNECTYLQACILHRFFFDVRANALTIISSSYSKKIATAYLTQLLAFDDDADTVEFAAQFGIIRHTDDSRCLGIHKDIDRPAPTLRVSKFVNGKNEDSLLTVLSGAYKHAQVHPQAVTDSFDERGRYVKDPVLTEAISSLGSPKVPRKAESEESEVEFDADEVVEEARPSPSPNPFSRSPSPAPPADSKIQPIAFGGFSQRNPDKPTFSFDKPKFSFDKEKPKFSFDKPTFSFNKGPPKATFMPEEMANGTSTKPIVPVASSSFSFKPQAQAQAADVEDQERILREKILKAREAEEKLAREKAEAEAEAAAREEAERAAQERAEQAAAREKEQREAREAEERRLRQAFELEQQEQLRIQQEQERNRNVEEWADQISIEWIDRHVHEFTATVCEKNLRIAIEERKEEILTTTVPVLSSNLIEEVVSYRIEAICANTYKVRVEDTLSALLRISEKIAVTRLKLRVRRYAMIWKSRMLVSLAKKRRWERFNKYYANVCNGVEHEQPEELGRIGRFYADPWTVSKLIDDMLISKAAEQAALRKPFVRQAAQHWRTWARNRSLLREELLKYEPLPDFKFGRSRKCMKPFRLSNGNPQNGV